MSSLNDQINSNRILYNLLKAVVILKEGEHTDNTDNT